MEFNKRVEFRVGNSRGVRFWKDRRCDEDFRDEAFLELFSIAFIKYAWVDQMWE